MRAFAISWTPAAASSGVSPSGSATARDRPLGQLAEIATCPSATGPAGISPSTTFASVTVGVARRRARSRPAPATRPRCAARPAARPPRRARRSSRRRRRPRRCRCRDRSSSPAPRISRLPADSEPPTSYSRPRETAPSSISDAFAVVPPMSKAIAFASRAAAPAERGDDAGRRPRLEREHRPRGRRPRRSSRRRTA